MKIKFKKIVASFYKATNTKEEVYIRKIRPVGSNKEYWAVEVDSEIDDFQTSFGESLLASSELVEMGIIHLKS